MSTSDHLRRRTFIGFGLAAAATSTIGHIPAQAQSPNDKLNLGIIGSGGRGGANLNGVRSEHIQWLCDINPQTLTTQGAKFPDAKHTTDWREVIADDSVDGVVISTADHHHAPAAIAAMRAGKHVYAEKPLAHTVQEARWMQDEYLKRKDSIATQMGTQIHAGNNFRRSVELIRAGAIGEVTEAHVWCSRGISPIGEAVLPETPVPEGFNWDVWLGPAPERAHNEGYWKGGNLNWNRRWDFGNGVLGDMGSHLNDLVWWALELHRPSSVVSEGPEVDPIAAPPWQQITWEHEDAAVGNGARGPIKLTWYHGGEGMRRRSERLQPLVGEDTIINKWGIGVCFIGKDGVLTTDYGKQVLSPSATFADFKRPEQSIPKSKGHYREWIDACKGNGETLCNFDYSGSLIEHNLLGNVAHRAGKKLNWDAKNLKVTNDQAANKLISKSYRKGWEI